MRRRPRLLSRHLLILRMAIRLVILMRLRAQRQSQMLTSVETQRGFLRRIRILLIWLRLYLTK